MNFLERIVKTKLIEVERAKEILPLRELKKIAESSNYNHRSLIDVLKQGDGVKIIAEITNTKKTTKSDAVSPLVHAPREIKAGTKNNALATEIVNAKFSGFFLKNSILSINLDLTFSASSSVITAVSSIETKIPPAIKSKEIINGINLNFVKTVC